MSMVSAASHVPRGSDRIGSDRLDSLRQTHQELTTGGMHCHGELPKNLVSTPRLVTEGYNPAVPRAHRMAYAERRTQRYRSGRLGALHRSSGRRNAWRCVRTRDRSA